MSKIVQARIDDATERLLERLRRRTGLSDSEILRRAIVQAASQHATAGHRRIFGLGRFASGHADLGSNKKHMAGFGRS